MTATKLGMSVVETHNADIKRRAASVLIQGLEIMSEHDQQCAVVSWWDWQFPQYKSCLIAIPNGSHLAGDRVRRARQVARLKKEGFKNGVSDLFLAVPKGGFHGLWIEMKDFGKTGKSVSSAQWAHINLMKKMGYYATWCAGSNDAIRVIQRYMNGDL